MTHSSFFLRRYAASVAVVGGVPEDGNSARSHHEPQLALKRLCRPED